MVDYQWDNFKVSIKLLTVTKSFSIALHSLQDTYLIVYT